MTKFAQFPGRQLARERGVFRSVVGSSLASAVLSAVQVGQLARERSDPPNVRERTTYDGTGTLRHVTRGVLRSPVGQLARERPDPANVRERTAYNFAVPVITPCIPRIVR